DDTAQAEAELTRSSVRVRLEDGQQVAVNDEALRGTRGTFAAAVDAADVYTIQVTDPRRGTDETDIAEPPLFEITAPGDGGEASLSGFTIEWDGADDTFDVEVDIEQRLLGDRLTLALGPITDEGSVVVGSGDIADA